MSSDMALPAGTSSDWYPISADLDATLARRACLLRNLASEYSLVHMHFPTALQSDCHFRNRAPSADFPHFSTKQLEEP